MTIQEDFINLIYPQSKASSHVWPDYATCEGCLESGFGKSKLFIEGKNLFGQKTSGFTSHYETLEIPTQEFINGQWVTIMAKWVKFPTLTDSFHERMRLLERLRIKYVEYDLALNSTTGEEFVINVSKRWSTDESRGEKVLSIYNKYKYLFDAPIESINVEVDHHNPDSFWEYLLNKLNLKK